MRNGRNYGKLAAVSLLVCGVIEIRGAAVMERRREHDTN